MGFLFGFARLLGGGVARLSMRSIVTQLIRLFALLGITDVFVRVTQPTGGVFGGVATVLHGSEPVGTVPTDVADAAKKVIEDEAKQLRNTVLFVGVGVLIFLIVTRR